MIDVPRRAGAARIASGVVAGCAIQGAGGTPAPQLRRAGDSDGDCRKRLLELRGYGRVGFTRLLSLRRRQAKVVAMRGRSGGHRRARSGVGRAAGAVVEALELRRLLAAYA